MIGSHLGSYEILEEVGAGGMGRVFKAHQRALDRIVAVKVLLPQFANDEVFVERFLREARSIATLEHPGIVTVYDVGESEGTYYFAMQFLVGRTLDQVISERGPLSAAEAAPILRQVAEALGHAHAAGILHRDVKPGNIFITDKGRVVLTDFGIAWAASQTRLTMADTSLGSPGYMAPEQVEGKPLDQRSDLYSLGIVFFEMLTGQTPYQGDSAVSVAYQHVQAPVPSVCQINSAVPPEADAITQRLMSKHPDERHDDAAELIEDLDRIARGEVTRAEPATGSRSRRTVGIAIAATLLALGMVTVLLLVQGRTAPAQSGGGASELADVGLPAGTTAAPDEPVAVSEIGGEGEGINTANAESPADEPGIPPIEAQAQTEIPPVPEPVEVQEPVEVTAEQAAPDTEAVAPVEIARTFRITSRPPGARVLLNGLELPQVTPTAIDIEAGTDYDVRLRLPGHEPVGWAFSLDDLSDAQQESGELHFPMASSVPPATLSLSATVPVRLEIGGKTYDGPISELELEPGSYSVRIQAPSVFYSDTRQIDLASGSTHTLDFPPLTSLTVAATPSRCRIRIDGRDAGYVPVQLDITVGTHEFLFDWDHLGKTLKLTRAITRQTDRVFAAAPTP